jgi:hypothetical protein
MYFDILFFYWENNPGYLLTKDYMVCRCRGHQQIFIVKFQAVLEREKIIQETDFCVQKLKKSGPSERVFTFFFK